MFMHPHIGREIARARQRDLPEDAGRQRRAQRLRAVLTTTRHHCGRAFALALTVAVALALAVAVALAPIVILTGCGGGHGGTGTGSHVGTATGGHVGTGTESRGTGQSDGCVVVAGQRTRADDQRRSHQPGPLLPEEPGTWDMITVDLAEDSDKRSRVAPDHADSAPPESS